MARTLKVRTLAALLALPLPAQAPSVEAVLRSELAFARHADEKGIRSAFLTWLMEDAPAFTPRLVRAREFYQPDPGDPGHLAWYPEAVGMAASGDLAWSYGPWDYAAKKGEKALAHGHFLSLWRRQANRGWMVQADIGIPHPAPASPVPLFKAAAVPPVIGGANPRLEDAYQTLRRKEAELAAAWSVQGGAALVGELADGARVLRPGTAPSQDRLAQRKLLEADRPGTRWEPAILQVAASGEFGWTSGETGPDDRGRSASFLRIWTGEAGAWKVLFDVRLPHPEAPK